MTDYQGLPKQLYRAEQVRELDRCAIEEFSVPGITLMRRAGRFAFDQLLLRRPGVQAISIWCGAGNNGGDGYIVAGLAAQRGLGVQLVQVGSEEKLKGDAALACQWARDSGVEFTPWCAGLEVVGDVVVDALLGTGLNQAVRSPFSDAIESINRAGAPVLAVDIPSGLCSDTGCVLGSVVNAELTTTFIGVKQGMLTGQGPVFCGDIKFDDLSVSAEVYGRVDTLVGRLDFGEMASHFEPRQPDAHKGHFGHVLVIGGNHGMGGAAIMAAQAAGRVGAGLVSVATQPENVPAFLARCPEVMAKGVADPADLQHLLKNKTVIVIGPGLGQDAWSQEMLEVALTANLPMVVDADALNMLADTEDLKNERWILTPHPGEAARLLGCSVAEIQGDRFAAVKNLQKRFGGVALLKGVGSLVAGPDQKVSVCNQGNPGMASGGMGDVLSGVLGGLLAQRFEQTQAAQLGVVLHAAAADKAAQQGERGLLATDLLPWLRALVNP